MNLKFWKKKQKYKSTCYKVFPGIEASKIDMNKVVKEQIVKLDNPLTVCDKMENNYCHRIGKNNELTVRIITERFEPEEW